MFIVEVHIKKIISMIILVTIPFLAGMGSMQGPSSPEKIPVPVKQYHATFVDQMDITTECKEVSIEGAIYLEGKRGEGNYTISFSQQVLSLRRLLDKSRTDATGTSLYTFRCPCLTIDATDFLKIRVPDLYALIVGMADFMTHYWFFPTYLTNS
jgi:hypothetical protein